MNRQTNRSIYAYNEEWVFREMLFRDRNHNITKMRTYSCDVFKRCSYSIFRAKHRFRCVMVKMTTQSSNHHNTKLWPALVTHILSKLFNMMMYDEMVTHTYMSPFHHMKKIPYGMFKKLWEGEIPKRMHDSYSTSHFCEFTQRRFSELARGILIHWALHYFFEDLANWWEFI